MTKQKNILGERPRKKNNRKIKASKIEEMIMKKAFEKACNESSIFCKYDDYKKTVDDNAVALHRRYNEALAELIELEEVKDYTEPTSVRLNIGLCEKPKPMGKVQAFIIIALTLLAFVGLFKLTQRAMDIHALNTCEQYGDCAEVIRDINAR